MAASAIDILTVGIVATGTVTQFQPILASGANCTAAGNAVGFARIGGVAADRIPTTVLGTSIAIAGAAIAVGALVEVHTTVAQVVTKSAGVAIGRALTAASTAGDQVEILIIPN
jgi:hypothetical protein